MTTQEAREVVGRLRADPRVSADYDVALQNPMYTSVRVSVRCKRTGVKIRYYGIVYPDDVLADMAEAVNTLFGGQP